MFRKALIAMAVVTAAAAFMPAAISTAFSGPAYCSSLGAVIF